MTRQTGVARTVVGKLDAMDMPTDPCVSEMRDVLSDMLGLLIAEIPAAGPHVARTTPSPTREAEVELPPLSVEREGQLKEVIAENVRLKAWKAEAMVSMRENEEWRGKLNDKACEFGYAGRHYLESACEIADRLKAALAEIENLKETLFTQADVNEAYASGAKLGPCCRKPWCGGDCTCEICAPELAIRDLQSRIAQLEGK